MSQQLKIFFTFCALIFAQEIWAQTVTLHTLDFESAGGYTTSSPECNDGVDDYFARTDGTDISGSYVYNSPQGSFFFAAQDMDAATCPNISGANASLLIDDINISGYSSLEIKFLVAEDDNGAAQNWDGTDYFHIDYDIDNSASFTNGFWVEATGTNTEPQVDSDFDGTGDGAAITSTFTEYTITIPSTGSLLDIRITFDVNAGEEDIAVDNIRVSGVLDDVSSETANNACFTQMDLSWALPSGYVAGNNTILVFAKSGSAITAGTPTNAVGTYTADADFSGSGTAYENDASAKCVYKGDGTSVTVTGLTSATTYHYLIYNVIDAGPTYSSGATLSASTISATDDVTDLVAASGNTTTTVSWTNPTSCFDEMIIVVHSSSITGTPVGTYTANSLDYTDVLNPNFPLGGKVVYNGSTSSQVVTNLTNGTTYYVKTFVRGGATWSTGSEVTVIPSLGTTTLGFGDLAIVGLNSNRLACGGTTGEDEISFVCFENIANGISLQLTDNGWERTNSNRYGNTEGTVQATLTAGGPIAAGTVITFRFPTSGQPGSINSVSPGGMTWSFTNINHPGDLLNMNSGGDQLFIMQGGTWNAGIDGSHNATYINGEVLFGFNTRTTWAADGTTQQSNLFPGLDCYNLTPAGANDFIKYTGPTTAATQRTWIQRYNNTANWTSYASCAAYDAAAPNYAGGVTWSILAGGFETGKWLGDIDDDWHECQNWSDYQIPDNTIDVNITQDATNDCRINAQNATAKSVTVSSTSNTLRDFTLTGGRTLTITNDLDLTRTNGSSGTLIAEVDGATLLVGGDVNVVMSNTGNTASSNINFLVNDAASATITGDLVITNNETTSGPTALVNLAGTAVSNLTCNNLTITGNGNATNTEFEATDNLAHTLTINGDFTMANAGLFDVDQANLMINLGGDWNNNDAAANFLETNTTINLNGSTDQNIGTSGFTETFHNITLSKTGGEAILQDDISMDASAILALNDDQLDLNGSELSITNSSTGAITRTSGSIVSESATNASKINWSVGTTGGDHIFPFATTVGGTYIPFTFTRTSGDVGIVTVSTYGTPNSNLPMPSTPDNVTTIDNRQSFMVDRYHQIDISGAGATTSDIKIGYADSEIDGATESRLRAQRWNGTKWEIPVLGSVNTGNNEVTVTGITQFCPWILVDLTKPLPVELVEFNAQQVDKDIEITWSTLNETNNESFTVQKSHNAVDWNRLAQIDGKGNSAQVQNYSLLDEHPFAGINYYRLIQTDFDQSQNVSDIVSVYTDIKDEFFVEHTSDFNMIIVHHHGQSNGTFSYQLIDVSSKVVTEGALDFKNSATSEIRTESLAKGLYFLIIEGNSRSYEFKLLR